MAKKDLIAEAKSKGIELRGDEKVPELEKLLKEFSNGNVTEEDLNAVEAKVEEDKTTEEEVAEEKVSEEPSEPVEEITEPTIADVIREQVADMQRRHNEWKMQNGVK